MNKLLYSTGVLSLILAGLAFALCGIQWLRVGREDGVAPGASLVEKGRTLTGHDADKGDVVSPLVAQATAFALYLNPPKPPAPPEAPRARGNPPQPAPKPVVTVPKFRLLLTSRHHSDPQKSLALISEPGKGDHWIRNGDRVGHLVIENIQDGSLLYRDGNQVHEMSVAMKQTVELARLVSVPPVATQSVISEAKLLHASRMKEDGVSVPNEGPAGQDQE